MGIKSVFILSLMHFSLLCFGEAFEGFNQKIGALRCAAEDANKSDLVLLITKTDPNVLVANLLQTKPTFAELSTTVNAEGTQGHQWNIASNDDSVGFFLGIHADVFAEPLPYTKSGGLTINDRQLSGKTILATTTVKCDFIAPKNP
jgi:hypothetical protein